MASKFDKYRPSPTPTVNNIVDAASAEAAFANYPGDGDCVLEAFSQPGYSSCTDQLNAMVQQAAA